jgi:hypothetical protein
MVNGVVTVTSPIPWQDWAGAVSTAASKTFWIGITVEVNGKAVPVPGSSHPPNTVAVWTGHILEPSTSSA